MLINEFIVEDTTLTRYGERGYLVGHGSHMVRVKSGEQYMCEATP